MKRRDLEDFTPGSLVKTPTGRYGIVTKLTYGADGDFPRCQIRYLDGITRDCVRLQPDTIELLAPGAKVLYAIRLLNPQDDEPEEDDTDER